MSVRPRRYWSDCQAIGDFSVRAADGMVCAPFPRTGDQRPRAMGGPVTLGKAEPKVAGLATGCARTRRRMAHRSASTMMPSVRSCLVLPVPLELFRRPITKLARARLATEHDALAEHACQRALLIKGVGLDLIQQGVFAVCHPARILLRHARRLLRPSRADAAAVGRFARRAHAALEFVARVVHRVQGGAREC